MCVKQLLVNIDFVIKNFYGIVTLKREKEIANLLKRNALMLATVESCTGGLVSSRMTDLSGSSVYIWQNFITYANEAKIQIIGVKRETIEKVGVVSKEVSLEMVKGVLDKYNCSIALSTTGIAGPTGGTKEKPVGLMFSTIYTDKKSITFETLLPSNTQREEMKYLFTQSVLERLNKFLDEQN